MKGRKAEKPKSGKPKSRKAEKPKNKEPKGRQAEKPRGVKKTKKRKNERGRDYLFVPFS